MKKGSVHVVKIGAEWRIRYSDGKMSQLSSGIRAAMVGWALSLGKEVIVYDEMGKVEEVLEPENRSRFHALMAVIALSFLAMITVAVWLIVWVLSKLN